MIVYVVTVEWPPSGYPGDTHPERDVIGVASSLSGAIAIGSEGLGVRGDPWPERLDVCQVARCGRRLSDDTLFAHVEIQAFEMTP